MEGNKQTKPKLPSREYWVYNIELGPRLLECAQCSTETCDRLHENISLASITMKTSFQTESKETKKGKNQHRPH